MRGRASTAVSIEFGRTWPSSRRAPSHNQRRIRFMSRLACRKPRMKMTVHDLSPARYFRVSGNLLLEISDGDFGDGTRHVGSRTTHTLPTSSPPPHLPCSAISKSCPFSYLLECSVCSCPLFLSALHFLISDEQSEPTRFPKASMHGLTPASHRHGHQESRSGPTRKTIAARQDGSHHTVKACQEH